MDTSEIRREANTLYTAVQPVLQMGSAYADLVLADVAKIVLLCGQSNKDLSTNELLGFLVFFAQVKQDLAMLNTLHNRWDISRDVRLRYQKEAVQVLLELKGAIANAQTLSLPALLNQHDSTHNTRLLEPTINALYRFAQIIVKADGEITLEEMAALSQVWQMLHTYTAPPPIPTPSPATVPPPAPAAPESSEAEPEPASPEGLEAVLQELNQLIGMENIKQEVQTLTNFLKVQKVRQERGMATTSVSLHSVFSGPPGTGKTTVARLVSRIFKELGFLAKGHLVETDRSGMVAEFIGGTAKKVDEKVKEALDGVLFIDEAYALTPKDSSRDFGQEAVDTLLKRMEDYRQRLVVIAAGYTDEMERFVESNPGLKSRFNRHFYFNDYTPPELAAIFQKMCKDSHFHPTEAAIAKLNTVLTTLYEQRDRTFGNARAVRNLFEKTIERQANRLAVLNALTDEVLTTILPEDIPDPAASPDSPDSADLPSSDSPEPGMVEGVPPTPDRDMQLQAFTALLQTALDPLRITVVPRFRGDRLQLLFSADPVPDPTEMARVTVSILKRSPLLSLTQIELYGKQPDEELPEWSQTFDLHNPESASDSAP